MCVYIHIYIYIYMYIVYTFRMRASTSRIASRACSAWPAFPDYTIL